MGKFKPAKSSHVPINVTLSGLDMMTYNFALQSNCSNITEKDLKAMNGITVAAALVEFLVVAILLAYVLIRREYKRVLERLFIYLLFATLLREAVLVSNVEHQFEYKQKDSVCSVLGALNLYTAVLVVVIVVSAIIYFLRRIAYRKSKFAAFGKEFELGFVTLTFLVPLIFSLGLFYTDIFGLSTAWCSLREYDKNCHKTNPVKKSLAGYGVFLLTGILCTILVAAMVLIYCRIARRKIKQATILKRQAVILSACLIAGTAFLAFVLTVSNIPRFNEQFIIFYIHTVVLSIFDILYPLVFLLNLKCQAVVATRKRRSQYITLPESTLNASAPESDRFSANSNTVSLTLQYTGEFTQWRPEQTL